MEPTAMDKGNTPAIELHIEELALHGFPAAARHSIGETVERELARLLGKPEDRSGLVDREIFAVRRAGVAC